MKLSLEFNSKIKKNQLKTTYVPKYFLKSHFLNKKIINFFDKNKSKFISNIYSSTIYLIGYKIDSYRGSVLPFLNEKLNWLISTGLKSDVEYISSKFYSNYLNRLAKKDDRINFNLKLKDVVFRIDNFKKTFRTHQIKRQITHRLNNIIKIYSLQKGFISEKKCSFFYHQNFLKNIHNFEVFNKFYFYLLNKFFLQKFYQVNYLTNFESNFLSRINIYQIFHNNYENLCVLNYTQNIVNFVKRIFHLSKLFLKLIAFKFSLKYFVLFLNECFWCNKILESNFTFKVHNYMYYCLFLKLVKIYSSFFLKRSSFNYAFFNFFEKIKKNKIRKKLYFRLLYLKRQFKKIRLLIFNKYQKTHKDKSRKKFKKFPSYRVLKRSYYFHARLLMNKLIKIKKCNFFSNHNLQIFRYNYFFLNWKTNFDLILMNYFVKNSSNYCYSTIFQFYFLYNNIKSLWSDLEYYKKKRNYINLNDLNNLFFPFYQAILIKLKKIFQLILINQNQIKLIYKILFIYQYFLNFKNNILLRNQNFNLNQFYDILSLSNCFLNQFFYYRHLYKFIDDKFIQMSIIKEKFDFINLMYYNKKICKLTCQINFKNSKIYKFSRIQQKFYDNYLNFKQNKVSKKNLFLKSFILFNSKTKSLTNFKQKMKEIRKLRLRILKNNSHNKKKKFLKVF